jgi:hypothetical protein
MDHSVFIAKFQKLPDALQQQLMDFVDRMLSQANKDHTAIPDGEDSLLPDVHDGIEWIVSNDKLLPITPASEKPDIKALFGIWRDDNKSLEELRKAAWGDRL